MHPLLSHNALGVEASGGEPITGGCAGHYITTKLNLLLFMVSDQYVMFHTVALDIKRSLHCSGFDSVLTIMICTVAR